MNIPNHDPSGEKKTPPIPCMKTWVIAKMDAWHNGPNGGQCPRAGTPEECSRYGVAAVQRWGAVVGVLLAARHVALCRGDCPEGQEGSIRISSWCGGVGGPCFPADNPQDGRRFIGTDKDFGCFTWNTRVGDESFRRPCDLYAMGGIPGALLMFARLAFLEEPIGPGRYCGPD